MDIARAAAANSPNKRLKRARKGAATVLNGANAKLWFRFIAERQRIFGRWQRGAPPPYTSDPHLTQGRMCNVFRFLDRQSVWCLAHILEPLRHRPADLLLNVLLFRCFLNRGSALAAVGLQSCAGFDAAAFEATLLRCRDELGVLSNAAYNVGSFGSFAAAGPGCEGGVGCKVARVAAMFREVVPQLPALAATLLAGVSSGGSGGGGGGGGAGAGGSSTAARSAATYEAIRGLKGVGAFTAYQVCIDLGYWRPGVYSESDHVIVGPGARRGLAWLFEEPGELDAEGCLRYLHERQAELFEAAGVGAVERQRLFGAMPQPPPQPPPPPPPPQQQPSAPCAPLPSPAPSSSSSSPPPSAALLTAVPPLNLMAIENCLCEGDKYLRSTYGSGRFKQRYTPSSGADVQYLANAATARLFLTDTWRWQQASSAAAARGEGAGPSSAPAGNSGSCCGGSVAGSSVAGGSVAGAPPHGGDADAAMIRWGSAEMKQHSSATPCSAPQLASSALGS
jgi:hypothetical protein